MSLQGTASRKVFSAALIAAMLAAFAVSSLTYHGILDYFFTGTDTLTLIEASRVHSFGDVLKLATEPLMAGTDFTSVAKFYRPLTTLSYGFDYALWNLNPWGFQLTNLLVNALVASLVVLVLFELSDGDLAFASLAGILFAIHPILVESVPATDRRQDMLAALFLLLSLVFFIRHRRSEPPSKLTISLSLGSYVLALAAKEIAVIALPLVFAQVFLFSRLTGVRNRFLTACRECWSFAGVTLVYVLWRTYILGGIGGYARSDALSLSETLSYGINVLHNYVLDLLYPADLFRIFDTAFANHWTWVLLAIAAAYLAVCVLRCGRWDETGNNTHAAAMVCYLLLWLAMPLLIFVITLTFAHRSMYIPAIPFSALAAYPAALSCRALRSLLVGRSSVRSVASRSWALISDLHVPVAAAGVLFVLYVAAYSPLLRTYGQWQDSGRIAFLVLSQLTSEARDLSPGYRIEVYDLPDRIRSYEHRIPRAKEVNYLCAYSIQSWLRLHYPHARGTVIVRSRSWPWEFTGNLKVGLVRLSHRSLVAFVEIGAKTARTNVAKR